MNLRKSRSVDSERKGGVPRTSRTRDVDLPYARRKVVIVRSLKSSSQ